MAAVIEIRTCRTTPGTREALIEALRARLPLTVTLGMKALAPFPGARRREPRLMPLIAHDESLPGESE